MSVDEPTCSKFVTLEPPPGQENSTFSQFIAKKRKNISPPSANTSKKSNVKPTAGSSGVPTSNRFEPLSDKDDDSDDEDEDTTPIKKQAPPPPLIIKGKVNNHLEFTNKIKSYVKKGFHIKYTVNNSNLYVHDVEERQKLINILNDEELQYYTYTDKLTKTHAYVIRGLDSEPEVQEIADELKNIYKLNIINVYKLRTNRRPLYMVVTTAATRLRELQDKIKYLMYTKIEWERHVNRKEIIQCHRCQKWGHATSNCRMNPQCVKCGASHWTRECTKPRDTEAKCANCTGSHTANNVDCPVYLRKLDERHRQREARQQQQQRQRPTTSPGPRFVPAPAPTRNVWAERAANRRAQLQSTAPERMPPTNSSIVRPALSVSDVRPAPATVRQPLLPLPPMCASEVAQSARAPPPVNANESVTQTQQLFVQMKTLKDAINLTNILSALRDLNNLLSKCTNKAEKFTTFLHFADNIDKYDI